MKYSTSEIENIKKKYKLTEKEFEEMYKKCEYVTFYNCTISDNPTAVFKEDKQVLEKVGIDVYSEKEFLKNNISAAIIDVDVYRALYPKTEEILNKYPTIYTNITAEATGKIAKRIISYAIDNKYSFIFEGTLRNTEAFETMKSMPKYFNKIVRVMAVPKVESLLTAFERNDEQVNISGYGRFTNVETHNITYEGVLNTIKTIEEEDNNIVIEVFTRGKDMTTPVKVFNSKANKGKASEKIIEKRINGRKKALEYANERLKKLLNNLRPKDEYEEEQLDKLIEEINFNN